VTFDEGTAASLSQRTDTPLHEFCRLLSGWKTRSRNLL